MEEVQCTPVQDQQCYTEFQERCEPTTTQQCREVLDQVCATVQEQECQVLLASSDKLRNKPVSCLLGRSPPGMLYRVQE